MLIVMKVFLVILLLALSAFLYTVAYAIVASYVFRLKAIGLSWLLHDPIYWILMVAIIGGEVRLGYKSSLWQPKLG